MPVTKIGDVDKGRHVEITRGSSYAEVVVLAHQGAVTQVREVVRAGYGQKAGVNENGVYFVETPLDGVRTYFEPFAVSADTECNVLKARK